MRDALRDEMIKKICVRDADNILDVGCGDGTFLHESRRNFAPASSPAN